MRIDANQAGNPGPRLLRGGVLTVILRIATVAASFAASLALARVLGPEGFGQYAFIMAALAIFALPVQMGLPTLILRETAGTLATGDWARMRGVFLWSNRLIVGMSALIVGLGLAGLWLFGQEQGRDIWLAVICGLLLVPVSALGRARGAALRGLHCLVQGQFPEDVLRPVLLALTVATLFWLLGHRATAGQAMALHLGAAMAAFALGLVFYNRARPATLATAAPSYDRRNWLRAVVPLAAVSGLQIIAQQTDLVMLGVWRSAPEVGYYKVAVSAAGLTTFGLTVLNMLLAPHFARLNTLDDMRALQVLAVKGAMAAAAMSVPVVLVFLVWGEALLRLVYGADYAASISPLLIITTGHVITAMLGMTAIFVAMCGLERFAARAWGLATVANVALNALFIPAFGMNGAAGATLVSTTFGSALLWHAIRREKLIDISLLSLLRRRQ